MENNPGAPRPADRVFTGLFYAVCFGLPLLRPQWYGTVMAALILCWFMTGNGHWKTRFASYRMMLLFSGIFVIDIAGMAYTKNLSYGRSYLETELPLLLFPILILSSSNLLTPVVIRRSMSAFVAGVITLNLASLGFISWDLWDPQRLEANVIIAQNSIVRIHPVFLSVFISFGLFFMVGSYFPLSKVSRFRLGWILFACSVLLVYLVWLNSRVGIFGCLAGAVFYVTYSLRKETRLLAYGGIVLVVLLLFTIPFSRERFFEAPLEVIDPHHSINLADYNTRTLDFRRQIYSCSWEISRNSSFFFGYGTGDSKDVLLDCYRQRGMTALLDKKLDSHSEYFAQLHRTGIAGLLMFLALIAVPFYFAFKYKSPLYGAFLILFAITAFFETTLSSQKGVTFFSLFSPLLYLQARQQYHQRMGTSALDNIS